MALLRCHSPHQGSKGTALGAEIQLVPLAVGHRDHASGRNPRPQHHLRPAKPPRSGPRGLSSPGMRGPATALLGVAGHLRTYAAPGAGCGHWARSLLCQSSSAVLGSLHSEAICPPQCLETGARPLGSAKRTAPMLAVAAASLAVPTLFPHPQDFLATEPLPFSSLLSTSSYWNFPPDLEELFTPTLLKS